MDDLLALHMPPTDTGCWVAKHVHENFAASKYLGAKYGERYAHRIFYKSRYPDVDIRTCALTRCSHNTYCTNPEHLSVGYDNGSRVPPKPSKYFLANAPAPLFNSP